MMWTWLETHENILGWAALASLVLFFAMVMIGPLLVIWLPRGYLTGEGEKTYNLSAPILWPYLFFKNGLGIILVIAGIAMLVLPGQGLLTMAVGISLSNIPGKRRLIRRILCRPRVLNMVNWMRLKAGKPPLENPHHPVC
ncbi:MAG: PGPGW domain-containing protein [Desulfobacterales bacterium]